MMYPKLTLAIAATLALFFLAGGCAAPTIPYLTERTLDVRGHAVKKLKAARMPFAQPYSINKAVCLHNPRTEEMNFTLEPGAEQNFLVSMSSVYAYENACSVKEWHGASANTATNFAPAE